MVLGFLLITFSLLKMMASVLVLEILKPQNRVNSSTGFSASWSAFTASARLKCLVWVPPSSAN